MDNLKIYAFADEASENIDRQIVALKRNGLCGLEIRGVDGVNVSKISLEKAREVRAKLDTNGLITWSIGSPIGKIGITEDFDAHLDKLKHTLEIANILGAKNIRLFSFFMPKEEPAENYSGAVIDRMGKMLDAAKGSGVALCHENEKGIYGDIADRCLLLHKTFPELKGIFDPANFVQCGEDTLQAWELLKDYIYYMHIKDANPDSKVVPAGCGAGNVAAIAKAFIKKGGTAFTIEPHLTVFKGLAELEGKEDKSVIGEYAYPDADTAFDAACKAFKELI